MPHRYSTAFSHIVLAGTGIYCLVKIKDSPVDLPHVTFGLITINSLIGIWRWGNPEYGDQTDGFYKFTSYIRSLFALPCITTTVCLGLGYDRYLSWAFNVLPVIPLVCYLANKSEEQIEEIIIPVNLIALAGVSFLAENYWSIATVLSYALDHYIVLTQGDSLENLPAQDLYNYGLCFFTYFALRAISYNV